MVQRNAKEIESRLLRVELVTNLNPQLPAEDQTTIYDLGASRWLETDEKLFVCEFLNMSTIASEDRKSTVKQPLKVVGKCFLRAKLQTGRNAWEIGLRVWKSVSVKGKYFEK